MESPVNHSKIYINDVCNSISKNLNSFESQLINYKLDLKKNLDDIENRFNHQIECLINTIKDKDKIISNLQLELENHKFDESNFKNFSVINQQSKEITELQKLLEIERKRNKLLINETNEINTKLKIKEEHDEPEVKSTSIPEKKQESVSTPQEQSEKIEKETKLKKEKKPRKPREKKNNNKTVKNNKKDTTLGEANDIEDKNKIENSPIKAKNQISDPEMNPDINDLDIIEYNNQEYYYSLKTYYVYEFANESGDIGICVGKYEESNDTILFN